jgi:ribosome-binding protein aMBF1 (putative translation factor)
MKCSRCKKEIEGSEIRFAIEGDWMGKPLCRKCKFETEEESREGYRRGREKDHRKNDLYRTGIYNTKRIVEGQIFLSI